MYQVSQRFQEAVLGSHVQVSYIEVLSGDDAVELDTWVDASVQIEGSAAIRSTSSFRLPDPDGTWWRSGLLSAYGGRYRLWRGVDYLDGTAEVVPLGVHYVQSDTRTETGEGWAISISGADASARASRPLSRPVAVRVGTPTQDAIRAIVSAADPGARFDFPEGAIGTTPTLLLDMGASGWESAMKLAASIGYNLYVDRLGSYRMAPAPTRTTPTVLTLAEGENCVITQPLEVTRTQVPNGFIVIGTASGSDSAGVRAEAWDEDPSSPTYRYGPYGENCQVVKTEKVRTYAQAQTAANGLLQRSLMGTAEVAASMVPNPALDVDDVVVLKREQSELTGTYVVASVGVPLVSSGVASLVLRRMPGVGVPTDAEIQALTGSDYTA